MKRIIVVLSVMAIMAAMAVAMAMPAFAAASEKASCVGEAFSEAPAGLKGPAVSAFAKQGGIGGPISGIAQLPHEQFDCELNV